MSNAGMFDVLGIKDTLNIEFPYEMFGVGFSHGSSHPLYVYAALKSYRPAEETLSLGISMLHSPEDIAMCVKSHFIRYISSVINDLETHRRAASRIKFMKSAEYSEVLNSVVCCKFSRISLREEKLR